MGQPKHALRLPDGRCVIEAVAEALGTVCRRMVVIGAPEALPETPHLTDLRAGQGPLGGIETLLASGLDTQYLVCPSDVPMVTAELFAALTVPSDAAATVFRIEGEPAIRPLPARIAASALATAQSLLDQEKRAVHQLMQSIQPHVIEAPGRFAATLIDLNTPQDYESLVKELRS